MFTSRGRRRVKSNIGGNYSKDIIIIFIITIITIIIIIIIIIIVLIIISSGSEMLVVSLLEVFMVINLKCLLSLCLIFKLHSVATLCSNSPNFNSHSDLKVYKDLKSARSVELGL